MRTYEELKTALMGAQNVGKKDKEKERKVEQCVQLELTMQKEIEASIESDGALLREIEKKRAQLDELVTTKYHLIYAREIDELKKRKEIIDAAQSCYDYALEIKADSNNVMVHTCELAEILKENQKMEVYDAKQEHAILQLTQQLFQQAKADITVFYTNRPAKWLITEGVGTVNGFAHADMSKPLFVTFRENVDSRVQQQAQKRMTADEFAQMVLNTKNTEKIVEWILQHIEQRLSMYDKSQNMKFFDHQFWIKVFEKEVQFEVQESGSDTFSFSEHNMQILYGKEMCDGLAKALATMTKLSIMENHELAEVQMYPVEHGYNIVYHEMNPDYAGMTGWGE